MTSEDKIFILLVIRHTIVFDETHYIGLKRNEYENKFVRIGYGMMVYKRQDWESGILDKLELKEQIITIE